MIKDRIAIFAGSGELPVILSKRLEEKGFDFIILIPEGISDFPLGLYDDKKKKVIITQVGKILKLLKKENITKIIFIGKIPKEVIFKKQKYDLKTLWLMFKMASKSDRNIFSTVIEELNKIGIEIIPQHEFLKDLLPMESYLTKRKPTRKEWKDIRIGMKHAKEIARLDIGQTIVIKRGTVVAVEAMEGTNETIKRAGKLAGEGCVVCKVQSPGHDPRFDIPTIGTSTIEAMIEAKARVLAIEARKTFVVNRKEVIKLANKHKISIVSVSPF